MERPVVHQTDNRAFLFHSDEETAAPILAENMVLPILAEPPSSPHTIAVSASAVQHTNPRLAVSSSTPSASTVSSKMDPPSSTVAPGATTRNYPDAGGTPETSTLLKKSVTTRACVNCKRDHACCDTTRPCRRCLAMDIGSTCVDAPVQKRGRKRKTGENAFSITSSSSNGLVANGTSPAKSQHIFVSHYPPGKSQPARIPQPDPGGFGFGSSSSATGSMVLPSVHVPAQQGTTFPQNRPYQNSFSSSSSSSFSSSSSSISNLNMNRTPANQSNLPVHSGQFEFGPSMPLHSHPAKSPLIGPVSNSFGTLPTNTTMDNLVSSNYHTALIVEISKLRAENESLKRQLAHSREETILARASLNMKEASLHFFKSIFLHSPFPAIIVDSAGRIVTYNVAFLNQYGFDDVDLNSSTVFKFSDQAEMMARLAPLISRQLSSADQNTIAPLWSKPITITTHKKNGTVMQRRIMGYIMHGNMVFVGTDPTMSAEWLTPPSECPQ